MLAPDQIATFQRDGVLILRGFFSSSEVDAVRESIAAHYGHPTSATEWHSALRAGFGFCKLDMVPGPLTHPRMARLYRCLHRTAAWAGDNQLVLRPGEEAPPWYGARAPHLDFPVAYPLRTLANNVIYWSDVERHGGAFMYWPESHLCAWEYFRRNPEDYLAQGARAQDQIWPRILEEMGSEPVEFLGRRGDLMIWHSLLMHSASRNLNPETRIATFGRWGVPPGHEPLYEFEADLWSYWDFAPEPDRCVAPPPGSQNALPQLVGSSAP